MADVLSGKSPKSLSIADVGQGIALGHGNGIGLDFLATAAEREKRRFHPEPFDTEMTQANGEPAIIFRVGGAPVLFIGVTFTDQSIYELRIIGNPDKLRSLPRE